MTVSAIDSLQKPLLGKIRFESILTVETGLHIGGGGENLNIGGLDKPVIRDPLTRYPYLPGSSIKGKLRAILERFLKKPLNRRGSRETYRYESDDLVTGFTKVGDGQFVRFDGSRNCQLSRIFGSTGSRCWIETEVARGEGLLEEQSPKEDIKYVIGGIEYITSCSEVKGRNAPARLIVRDCHLRNESAKILERVDTGLYMTEWKFENGLDRITAAANPRQVERVPKGAKFDFEMIYTVEEASQVAEDLKHLAISLAILEDDALGGHGSRGYGKIKFSDIRLFCRNLEYYHNSPSQDDEKPFAKFDDVSMLLNQFGNLTSEVQKLLQGLE